VKEKEKRDFIQQRLTLLLRPSLLHLLTHEAFLKSFAPILTEGSPRCFCHLGEDGFTAEKGVDVRGRFVIDPEGIVRAMEVLTPPVGRNVAVVLCQLMAFQHHQKTGELMPSGW